MKIKKRTWIIALAVLLIVVFLYIAVRTQMVAKSPVTTENAKNFGTLLTDLVQAYETPSEEDDRTIQADLDVIRSVSEDDYLVAQALTDTWREVYMSPDYRLFIYGKDDPAVLRDYGVEDSPRQAIVILGYALADGEMQPELMSRCDAAADLARAFPQAIIVCSGGATGKNNPDKHTEAGLMKEHLTEQCGISASRIFIDEEAMTTVENVRNTFEILQKHNIQTMTIVTSQYHQRRSQALYGVMAEICRLQRNYSVQSVGNYCYEIESSSNLPDAKLAIQGMVELLHLPKDTVTFTPPPAAASAAPEQESPAA